MKLGIKRMVEVDAKTLRIHCKLRDEFEAYVHDAAGNELGGQSDGYVPGWMPEGGGDYLILNIDLDTGQITNWEKPEPHEVAAFIQRNQEDE